MKCTLDPTTVRDDLIGEYSNLNWRFKGIRLSYYSRNLGSKSFWIETMSAKKSITAKFSSKRSLGKIVWSLTVFDKPSDDTFCRSILGLEYTIPFWDLAMQHCSGRLIDTRGTSVYIGMDRKDQRKVQ